MIRIAILLSLLLNLSLYGQSGPDAQAPALQTLIRSTIVSGIPANGPVSDEINAMRQIFTMPNAEMEFVKVYRYAESNAGKIYALIGMQALGSHFYTTFKTDFTRKPQGNVQVNINGTEATANAVTFIGEWEQAANDQQGYTQVRD
jgi:hypothetical protein